MRPSVAIATFFCLWFITLFAVLPFFARPQDEEGDGTVVPGTPGSAPSKINMWKVFAANTVLAVVVFAIVYTVIDQLNR